MIFRLLAVQTLAFVYLKVHWVYPPSMAIVPPLYSRINLKELIRGVIYLRILNTGEPLIPAAEFTSVRKLVMSLGLETSKGATADMIP